jgi:hypothetical protein
VNENYEPDSVSAAIDIQRTSSLVSPYSGRLTFDLVTRYTAFHKNKSDAAVDSDFTQSKRVSHIHTYAFQNGKWVPQVRRYMGYGGEYDRAETINMGPDAGAVSINGC